MVAHLGDGELTVEIAPEAGGRISQIRFRGQDLLRPRPSVATRFGDFGWGSFVMAPWCNRLPAGPLKGIERPSHLAANSEDGTAIHGLVHDIPWELAADGRLQSVVEPGGFPWRFRMRAAIDVTGTTLIYRVSLQNIDEDPMPAGLGWHPWFNVTDGGMTLAIDADLEYRFDDNYLPADHPHHQNAVEHLASSPHHPEWGSHRLYTRLGSRSIPLLWPDSGVAAVLSFGGPIDHILVYASAELRAIAIEPQTHAPDGLRRLQRGLPGALTLLAPSKRIEVSYRLDFSQ